MERLAALIIADEEQAGMYRSLHLDGERIESCALKDGVECLKREKADVVGAVDDRHGLGWKVKFGSNVAAASIVIFGGNVVIRHLGSYGALGSIELGVLSIPVTYLGIIGVINALNMIDGLNGLAGGVSLLSFLFMGIAASIAGDVTAAVVCTAFVGALIAFLRFSFPEARIFMGDSGSMFLGFSLAFVAIQSTQGGGGTVNPMLPVLVLLLPLFDTLRVMTVRMMKRKSPFQADKSHLHHLIIRRKISPFAAVLFLWSLALFFGLTALLLEAKAAGVSLVFALYASLFLGFLAVSLTWRRRATREDRLPVYEAARRRAIASVAKLQPR